MLKQDYIFFIFFLSERCGLGDKEKTNESIQIHKLVNYHSIMATCNFKSMWN